MSWVLDTSGLLCWLNDETGAVRVRAILNLQEPIAIHAVNMVETQYLLLRRGEPALQAALLRIRRTRIEIVREMDDPFLEAVAYLKAFRAPIALGDTFAVALAMRRRAVLVTTDRGELEKIAAAGLCTIEFLR